MRAHSLACRSVGTRPAHIANAFSRASQNSLNAPYLAAAALAATLAAVSAPAHRGGVSRYSTSAPAPATRSRSAPSRLGAVASTTGAEDPRRSPHPAAVPCGSRSSTATLRPCCTSATARCRASVVFPAPPLALMIAMVCMLRSLCSARLLCALCTLRLSAPAARSWRPPTAARRHPSLSLSPPFSPHPERYRGRLSPVFVDPGDVRAVVCLPVIAWPP